MFLAAIFVPLLWSPITIVPAILFGLIARAWLHVFGGSTVVGIVSAVALAMSLGEKNVPIVVMVVGTLAALVWSSAAYGIKLTIAKRLRKTGG